MHRVAERIAELRAARAAAQARLDSGTLPAFPAASRELRATEWRVNPGVPPDGEPVRIELSDLPRAARSASYFDIRGLHSRDEARLFADLFAARDDPVRANVTVDSLHAAFALDEIVYELRDCIVALRWHREAYLLSFICALHRHAQFTLPDRSELAIGAPFLRALGKHARRIGERRNVRVEGFPAPPVDSHNPVDAGDLLQIHKGRITADGVRENLQTALQYHAGGDVDEASGELALAQLWQWVHHATGVLDEGRKVDIALLEELLEHDASGSRAAGKLLRAAAAATPPCPEALP